MVEKTVIIGAGQAGVAVAFKLRSLGYKGDITLVGEESYIPYHRPPLSKKFIANLVDEERLYLKQPNLYESERIELQLGCSVIAIHRSEKKIELENGNILKYDYLVMATGASARQIPEAQGGNANNIYTLRNLSDAKNLREQFKENRVLLVIGGGYIGLEIAAVARSIGMKVTLVERENRILARVASAQTAGYFKKLHQDNEVCICEGVGLDSLVLEKDRAVKAKLTDGSEIDVDVIVAGIGVVPEVCLAKNAGLNVSNGIVVDRFCRTSDSEIYAVGDCANFPYKQLQVRLESVQNAVDMADTVANSILGQSAEYHCFPWFWSDQYSTKLQIAGLSMGYTHVSVRKKNDLCISIWYYNHDRFIAVDAINDAKAFMTAKKWLREGKSPDPVEIENVSLELDAISLSEQNDLNLLKLETINA